MCSRRFFDVFAYLFTTWNLCIGLVCSAPLTDPKKDRPIWEEDFNQKDISTFAQGLFKDSHVTLAKNCGPDGTDAIRVAYVPCGRGSERVVARCPLPSAVDEASLAFDVCFDRDFIWAKGGKLHGLGPQSPITGGAEREPDGWSARVMFKEDGHCATYLYDQNKTKTYGIGSLSDKRVFQAGQWHHVVLHVRLNQPGKEDGSAQIFVDGRQVVKTDGVIFRTDFGKKTLIQNFLFSTFHGGSTGDWSPRNARGEPITVYALFDNFQISEGQPVFKIFGEEK